MCEDTSDPHKQLEELAVWWIKSTWRITFGLSGALVVLGVGIRYFSNADDFFLNLSVSFIEIGLGLLVTAFVAWLATRNKFEQIAMPLLEFIQRQRIDGKLTECGARSAVALSVAFLSEETIGKRLLHPIDETRNECPICTLTVKKVADESKGIQRCSHCHLSQAIWNHPQLLKANAQARQLKKLSNNVSTSCEDPEVSPP
ncbi:MAG TPA: hypothetical protein VN844_20365 [Pyrinomonadaceae bacterium]|nr:hypothetical protein [Pyrinomonadaceae bacterium]